MVAALIAAGVSALWCSMLPRLGPALGFVDRPGGEALKVHSLAAVPLAGPGLLLGVAGGLAVAGVLERAYLPGLVALTALGVVDDRFQISPSVRLSIEVVAAASIAITWWDAGPWHAVGGAAVVVLAVNATNLYDGLDMLAGSTAAAGLGVVAVVAGVVGADVWLPLLLAVALLGFLPFNLHPAKVFLGDGGAYLVGGIVAVSAWDVGVEVGGAGVLAAMGLLGMFLVDLVVTLARRLRSGQPLFQGDRGHLYDLMVATGIPLHAVVIRLLAAHLVIVGATAVALAAGSRPVALIAVSAIGLAATAMAWRFADSFSRSADRPAPPGT